MRRLTHYKGIDKMFTEVIKIETKDGKLFNSEKEAEDYITDKMCEEVNEIIKKVNTYDLKFRDLTAILLALTGTKENAIRLYNVLDKYI